MIEQDRASIMHFIISAAGSPAAYYEKIPEGFVVPSVYFPPVDSLISDGETLLTYGADSVLYVKFFARTDELAYSLGKSVLVAIRGVRDLLPLVDDDGKAISGEYIRVRDPVLRVLDTGAAEMTVAWRSRYPYDDVLETRPAAEEIVANITLKEGD